MPLVRHPTVEIATKADTKGTEALADSLDKTEKKAKGTGKAMSALERDVAKLDKEIVRTDRHLKDLARSLAEAGESADPKMFRELRTTQGRLGTLKKARGLLGSQLPPVPPVPGGGAGGGLFTQALGSPMVPGIAAAIVAGSPVIGAAMAAALLTGIGGGVVAGGIAAAVQDADVKAAFKPVGGALTDVFVKGFGDAFKSPLMGSAGFLTELFGDMRGEFVQFGKTASQLIEPLTKGLGGFVKNMMTGGGFAKALDAAVPIVQILSEELPHLGSAMDDFFESISDAGPGAQEFMRFFMDFLSAAIVGTGNLVEFLSKVFDRLTNIAEKTRFLTYVFGPLWGMLGDAEMPQKLDATGDAAESTFGKIDTGAADAAEAVKDLNAQFDDAFDKQMDLDKAADDFKESLLTLKEAVEGNGKSLKDNTLEGLANRDALRSRIEVVQRMRDAEIAMGDGTKEATDRANEAYRKRLDDIRKAILALGFEAKAVDALMQVYRDMAKAPNITKKVNIEFVTKGTPPPTSTRGTVYAYAQGGIARAQTGMITDRPTVLFGERRSTGLEGFVPQHGISRQRAHSLMSEMGRWHGLNVDPVEKRGGSGGTPSVQLVVSGSGSGLDNLFITWLQEAVRTGRIQLRAGGTRVTT